MLVFSPFPSSRGVRGHGSNICSFYFSSNIAHFVSEERAGILAKVAESLLSNMPQILSANEKDLEAAMANKISPALLSRLKLTEVSSRRHWFLLSVLRWQHFGNSIEIRRLFRDKTFWNRPSVVEVMLSLEEYLRRRVTSLLLKSKCVQYYITHVCLVFLYVVAFFREECHGRIYASATHPDFEQVGSCSICVCVCVCVYFIFIDDACVA